MIKVKSNSRVNLYRINPNTNFNIDNNKDNKHSKDRV